MRWLNNKWSASHASKRRLEQIDETRSLEGSICCWRYLLIKENEVSKGTRPTRMYIYTFFVCFLRSLERSYRCDVVEIIPLLKHSERSSLEYNEAFLLLHSLYLHTCTVSMLCKRDVYHLTLRKWARQNLIVNPMSCKGS